MRQQPDAQAEALPIVSVFEALVREDEPQR